MLWQAAYSARIAQQRTRSHRPRLLFVTAGMGAGHNEAAAELARRAHATGASTWVMDVLQAAGSAGDRPARIYRALLDHAPWFYGAAMAAWRRWPALLERVTAWGAGPFDTALSKAIDQHRPDVIVSTYNLASQALGRLALRGRTHAPVITMLVDPGAHPYWVSPGVELTLAPTLLTAAALRRYGASNVAVANPPLRPEFRAPPTRDTARRILGWPVDGRFVVINAGSWVAGHIEAALSAVARAPDITSVVLCARDEQLQDHLRDRERTIAVSWTTNLARYLAAADAVVDNAGGLTCWEAIACRTPVLIYRPLPGHGKLSAATLDRSGLARWVRSRRELVFLLRGNDFRSDPPRRDHEPEFGYDDVRDPLTYVMDIARRST